MQGKKMFEDCWYIHEIKENRAIKELDINEEDDSRSDRC